MKAMVLEAPGEVAMRDLPMPEPAPVMNAVLPDRLNIKWVLPGSRNSLLNAIPGT